MQIEAAGPQIRRNPCACLSRAISKSIQYFSNRSKVAQRCWFEVLRVLIGFILRFLTIGAIWVAKRVKNLTIRICGRLCEFFQSSWAAFFVFWVSESREGSPPGTSIRKLSKKCTRGQSSQYNTEKSYDKRVFEWGSVLEARSGDTGASGSTALVARALDIRRTVPSHISIVPTLNILG